MEKELECLMYLIKLTNFNKNIPQNHSFCVTSLDGNHASIINDKTNSIIKTDKIDLFDKILISSLKNLETISDNKQFTYLERKNYKEKISKLKNILFQTRKGMRRYYKEINMISYNNRNIVQETWASLKKLDMLIQNENKQMISSSFNNLENNSESSSDTDNIDKKRLDKSINKIMQHIGYKPIIQLYKDESSESDDIITCEIIIKNKKYILENNNIYTIKDDNKDKLYEKYINGKIKKNNIL